MNILRRPGGGRLVELIVIMILVPTLFRIDFAAPTALADERDGGKRSPRKTCFLEIARNPDKRAADIKALADIRALAELSDGYGLGFEGADEKIEALVEFLIFERKCCVFLTYELIFESHERMVWLNIRGGADIKELIGQLLPRRVKKRILRPSTDD
jgi:hypothetical protein